MLETRSGRRASQNAYELGAFVNLLRERGVTRYLEIGTRHGDTFFHVMRSLPKRSTGVAVDLPGGNWGRNDSRFAMMGAIDELKAGGYDVTAIFGDSRSVSVRNLVRKHGFFDAILIDGDHVYDGVKADWLNYGPMAPLVAFHDIVGTGKSDKAGNPVEVPLLWAELKAEHDHVEIIDDGSKMGIGAVLR